MKLELINADTVRYNWNIREADNRISVSVLHTPAHDLWYTSYDCLFGSEWDHVLGSVVGHGQRRHAALARAQELYESWRSDRYIREAVNARRDARLRNILFPPKSE